MTVMRRGGDGKHCVAPPQTKKYHCKLSSCKKEIHPRIQIGLHNATVFCCVEHYWQWKEETEKEGMIVFIATE